MAMSTQRLLLTLFMLNLVIGIIVNNYNDPGHFTPTYAENIANWLQGLTQNLKDGLKIIPNPVADLVKSVIDLVSIFAQLLIFITSCFLSGATSLLITAGYTYESVIDKYFILGISIFTGLMNVLLGLEIYLIHKANKAT